jgi:hypothetical protein
VEILVYDIYTKRSSNLAPFDNKISKSGDGGDIFHILSKYKL